MFGPRQAEGDPKWWLATVPGCDLAKAGPKNTRCFGATAGEQAARRSGPLPRETTQEERDGRAQGDAQGQQAPITNGMIVGWATTMYGSPFPPFVRVEIPPEDKWVKIPENLLGDYNIQVAYVNFWVFRELYWEVVPPRV